MKIRTLNQNKFPVPYGFHPRAIKQLEEEIAPHFCDIYKEPLVQRKSKKDWKEQYITQIMKKGFKDQPGNYRPIRMTSIPGKMSESIIADRVVSHLEANGPILDS